MVKKSVWCKMIKSLGDRNYAGGRECKERKVQDYVFDPTHHFCNVVGRLKEENAR